MSYKLRFTCGLWISSRVFGFCQGIKNASWMENHKHYVLSRGTVSFKNFLWEDQGERRPTPDQFTRAAMIFNIFRASTRALVIFLIRAPTIIFNTFSDVNLWGRAICDTAPARAEAFC